MKTLWLALPAYNEENALPSLLERCLDVRVALQQKEIELGILVVDDGSSDSTVSRARGFADHLHLEVVPHGRNRGLGAALRTGLMAALQRAGSGDMIATMDADNTHDPALLPAMADHMERNSTDVVIASRYVRGGEEVGLSPLRKILSRGASFLLSMTVPVHGARDYTCGFRLYRASTLARAAALWGEDLVEESGFTCMAEVLLKLGRGGARVSEWPLILRYDRKEGASKMKVLRTIVRYFGMAMKIRGRRMPDLRPPA
jgi:dolichol-phosphate mannosyltransferase